MTKAMRLRRALSILSLASLAFLAACGGGGGGGGGGGLPLLPPPSAGTPPPETPPGEEPIGTLQQMYDGALTPALAVSTFRNTDRLFPTRIIPKGTTVAPLSPHSKQIGALTFSAGANTSYTLEDFITQNRLSGVLVLKDGKVALERYALGNTDKTRWMSASIAKSMTSTLVGAALRDGYIGSLDDQAVKYLPRLVGSAYDGVTVRQLLTMSSGVKWDETYTNAGSDRRAMLNLQIGQQPGAVLDFLAKLPRAAAPGTRNNYSTGETQVLGEVLRSAIQRPLVTYMSEKIWAKYGMEADANWWIVASDGHEMGGGGIAATLRDYGRFGQFFLDGGFANGEKVLPDNWRADATRPTVLQGGATVNYGYLWWLGSAPSGNIMEGAFNGLGIFGQVLHINPQERLVIVLWSARTQPDQPAPINENAFFAAVAQAMR